MADSGFRSGNVHVQKVVRSAFLSHRVCVCARAGVYCTSMCCTKCSRCLLRFISCVRACILTSAQQSDHNTSRFSLHSAPSLALLCSSSPQLPPDHLHPTYHPFRTFSCSPDAEHEWSTHIGVHAGEGHTAEWYRRKTRSTLKHQGQGKEKRADVR